jgi:cation diffusion facilitator CzcD-associated flavoprotein CzcO
MSEHVHIAIVGAGFSGVGAAIRLRQSGIHDFVVFERSEEVGGVWRDNRYPGCACDVESPLYSYSFAPNPEWSRMYSPQAEILEYVRRCASEYGVLSHVRFKHTITQAAWDPERNVWQLDSPRGRFTADVLVAGMGALSTSRVPPIRGSERFEGRAFHSASWEHDAALDGQRVAVVGTGASAIQIVPRIQPKVGHLSVFQRTAPWVVPREDRAFGPVERRMFAALPITQKLLRAGIYLRHESLLVGFRNPAIMRVVQRRVLRYLEHQIQDPELRGRLRPDFTLGCKRVLLSDDYYPALVQDNVELVSAGVRELVPTGIVDTEGRLHELDTIIWATGFEVANPPFARHVRGRSGESLAEIWRGSPTAYLGTMVAGFPNLVLLTGPNTGLGHNSMIVMIEAQIELLLGMLRELDRGEVTTIEPDPQVQARYVSEIDRGGEGTVWTAGGCASWYLDETGRNSTLWPWSTYAYMRRAKFERDDYVLE